MNGTSIGKRIRACREEKGWSQEIFAEKIGLSIAYTGMIERGEKVPKLETFVRIANALEVSADLLLPQGRGRRTGNCPRRSKTGRADLRPLHCGRNPAVHL